MKTFLFLLLITVTIGAFSIDSDVVVWNENVLVAQSSEMTDEHVEAEENRNSEVERIRKELRAHKDKLTRRHRLRMVLIFSGIVLIVFAPILYFVRRKSN